ncbi:hypothetical protein [uncultured Enterococcus sp.]|uniref:hypothetical protein n=1 Tax=uncultured Enterococcus sp. TaxID=167972 RepID=UPI002AA8F829|nr:hypothetical protein [uncultured Enterococcus sp.]
MKDTIDKPERAAYDQLILENENQLEYLGDEKRKLEHTIQNLEEDLQLGFQKLASLNNEVSRYGHPNNLAMQQDTEEQEWLFRQLLQESNEQITTAYKNETAKIDEEREILYKERREQSWD